MEWVLKLAAAGDQGPSVDIMEISKSDDLGDIANLGLTLTEAKQLLARVQREISAAQAREQAVPRPVCPCRNGICRVKDYRDHAVATLFGQATLRLPRFRLAACGRVETGINWRWCTCRQAGDLAPVLSRYAMTRRRRTDFGRPAASIRLRTATPMAASVCCTAKPRACSRGPISAL